MTLRQRYLLATVAAFVVGFIGCAVVLGQYATVPVQTYSAGRSYDEGTLREILFEIKGVREELKALRAAAAATRPLTLTEIIRTKCAACHAEGVYKQKQAFAMLLREDGTVPPFSLIEQQRIIREVRSNRMPKELPPLSESEKEFLFKALEGAQ